MEENNMYDPYIKYNKYNLELSPKSHISVNSEKNSKKINNNKIYPIKKLDSMDFGLKKLITLGRRSKNITTIRDSILIKKKETTEANYIKNKICKKLTPFQIYEKNKKFFEDSLKKKTQKTFIVNMFDIGRKDRMVILKYLSPSKKKIKKKLNFNSFISEENSVNNISSNKFNKKKKFYISPIQSYKANNTITSFYKKKLNKSINKTNKLKILDNKIKNNTLIISENLYRNNKNNIFNQFFITNEKIVLPEYKNNQNIKKIIKFNKNLLFDRNNIKEIKSYRNKNNYFNKNDINNLFNKKYNASLINMNSFNIRKNNLDIFNINNNFNKYNNKNNYY